MSLGNLLIVIVLTLGLAAMFVWTLSLNSELGEVQTLVGAGGEGAPPGGESRIDGLEDDIRELNVRLRSYAADLGTVEIRLDDLEKSNVAQDGRIAALAKGDNAAATVGLEAGGDEALRAAIEDVLEKRQVDQRKAWTQRRAEGMARFLLADVQATEDQRARFVKAVVTYLDSRDEIRQRYSGDNPDEQARDAAYAELDRQRNDNIQQIFGAGDAAKIEERLQRGRRMLDGRGPGSRGGRTSRQR